MCFQDGHEDVRYVSGQMFCSITFIIIVTFAAGGSGFQACSDTFLGWWKD